MAGLSTPIKFTLPQPTNIAAADAAAQSGAAADSGLQAVCSFWDALANNGTGGYATDGCVSRPSPLPPNVTLGWTPGFAARDAKMLAKMWNFTADAWLGWNGSSYVKQDINVSTTFKAALALVDASMLLDPWPYPPLLMCSEAFIDCSNATQQNRTIYPARPPAQAPHARCLPPPARESPAGWRSKRPPHPAPVYVHN